MVDFMVDFARIARIKGRSRTFANLSFSISSLSFSTHLMKQPIPKPTINEIGKLSSIVFKSHSLPFHTTSRITHITHINIPETTPIEIESIMDVAWSRGRSRAFANLSFSFSIHLWRKNRTGKYHSGKVIANMARLKMFHKQGII